MPSGTGSGENSTRAEATNLSTWQQDVAALVGQGHSNEEISLSLFVKLGTVKEHIIKTYIKLKELLIKSFYRLSTLWGTCNLRLIKTNGK